MKKKLYCFDWWAIDELVNNDNNSTKLVKLSHLERSINNYLPRPIYIVMNQQQNIDQKKKQKSQLGMMRLETK